MKKATFHILLTFSLIGVTVAQSSQKDSLLNLTTLLTGEKLARTFYELSMEPWEHKTDSALYFANQAELILQKNDPEALMPYVFKRKGEIYEQKMNFERSLSYFGKACEEFIKLENEKEVGLCALIMGNIHYELADYGDAYSYYLQSLNAYEKLDDNEGIAWMENNLGAVSHEMGNLDEAENHYMNSYEIYKEKENVTEESRALSNIGLILYDKLQYDLALLFRGGTAQDKSRFCHL